MTNQTKPSIAMVRAMAKKKGLEIELQERSGEIHAMAAWYYVVSVFWHTIESNRPLTRAQALTAMMAALRSLPDKPKEKR